MQPLVTGYIFVDAFLLMSGLLVARSILNAKAENRSIRAILTGHPRRLLHRYIRLTPSLLAILLAVILLELTGNHKFVWFVQTKLPQYWWRIFLYTTNYSISNGVSNSLLKSLLQFTFCCNYWFSFSPIFGISEWTCNIS